MPFVTSVTQRTKGATVDRTGCKVKKGCRDHPFQVERDTCSTRVGSDYGVRLQTPSLQPGMISLHNRLKPRQGLAMTYPRIEHHGAINGVTGSCHQLHLTADTSVLIDCGLFQGAEISQSGTQAGNMAVEFPLAGIQALILTHVHIDHVGRLPWLIAAGFNGPVYCTEPSAMLLPTVLEDAFLL